MHPTYSALSEDWSFSIEAKYASMRTLPDPFGIPGPSFMPSLSARTIPKFYPPDFGSHTMRVQTLQVGGWRPVRASQMAKNSPASPRVVRRGTARPAEKSFHSASFEAKHRNSTTIRRAGQSRIAFLSVPRDADDCNSTVPSCVFYHRTHRIRLRRTQKEVGKRCRPDASTTTLSQGTRSVASASPTHIPISHTKVV